MITKEEARVLSRDLYTSADVLDLIVDNHDEYSHFVAAHPNVSLQTLEKLAKTDNYYIRWEVAKNPKTPKKLLELLSRDRDYSVLTAARESLVKRKYTITLNLDNSQLELLRSLSGIIKQLDL